MNYATTLSGGTVGYTCQPVAYLFQVFRKVTEMKDEYKPLKPCPLCGTIKKPVMGEMQLDCDNPDCEFGTTNCHAFFEDVLDEWNELVDKINNVEPANRASYFTGDIYEVAKKLRDL